MCCIRNLFVPFTKIKKKVIAFIFIFYKNCHINSKQMDKFQTKNIYSKHRLPVIKVAQIGLGMTFHSVQMGEMI